MGQLKVKGQGHAEGPLRGEGK